MEVIWVDTSLLLTEKDQYASKIACTIMNSVKGDKPLIITQTVINDEVIVTSR